ncbi:response regulator [Aquihabitans sp. McL0605]|uniref:response regulator n=1 Tax=Aquihabitans sp. McL0605 TaxID=3415671 RepID=UPI003CE8F3A8
MNSTDPLRRPSEPARILLVEDDPGDVLITRESLAESQVACDLSVVDDGQMALDYLHKRGAYADAPTPHLVLLDLNLPKVSGHEVLAEVKGDPDLAPIPVIVLSTSAADEDVLQTYALHANAFITKPVDFDRFHDVVRSIDHFFLNVAQLPRRRDDG